MDGCSLQCCTGHTILLKESECHVVLSLKMHNAILNKMKKNLHLPILGVMILHQCSSTNLSTQTKASPQTDS